MDIKNRFTGAIIFTSNSSTMKELVQSAAADGVNLNGAYLRGEDLSKVSLRGARLGGADFREADLRLSDLSYANMRDADFRGARLCGADLCRADLGGADLREADLREADLNRANLNMAELSGANLMEANMNLAGGTINGHRLISVSGFTYPILMTDATLQICGFEYTFDEWKGMTSDEVEELGGIKLLKFYPTLKGLISLVLTDREIKR